MCTECENAGSCMKQIKEIKSKLELIDQERYEGAMVRARAERLWNGETPTKRALSDEKRYATKKEIEAIIYQNEETSEPTMIERAFVAHYRELLGSKKKLEKGFERDFLNLMPRLEEDIKANLELPITLREIEDAIDGLGAGKAPGPDGLGAAFYKAFKHQLSQLLHCVFEEMYTTQRTPPSFRTSHIVLIPKCEDPVKLLSVKSYRPISLTNCDYKIFTKVLAKRLQSVVTHLVGPQQTCGIKGRTISTNTHVARCVLECCDALSCRVALLQLDLEKAFDNVSHEVLFSLLEYVNVGGVILNGVKMAYSECSTRIIINKKLSEPIQLLSSVRQGCAISSLLFDLYLEPFCLSLINSQKVRGFMLEATEVKVLAYADDIAVFCQDQESIKEVVRLTGNFCKEAGCKINWEKTIGFWHGEWSEKPESFAGVQWTAMPTTYLGAPLQCYDDPEQYWKEETERVKDKILGWQRRNLSMFARATTCNLFLVAKLWYVLQVLFMSRANLQKIHRVFAVFIWGGSWERTSRTNLFLSVKKGGLGLTHLFIRQIVSRFMFLRDQSDPFLRTVIQVRLHNALPEFIVCTNKTALRGIRGYWHEVVAAFRILKVRFSFEYLSTVKRKNLYRDLLDVMLPVPLYRSIYTGGSGQDVLKRVKGMPIKPHVKSFFFKLHTNTLPVKTWLHDKGIFVPWTVNCMLCKKPETMEHVFIDCWDPIFHWDILQRTIKKELPITPHGIRYLPVENDGDIPYDMIMVLSLHSIWKTRMAVRHADVDPHTVRENFIEHVVYMREIYRAQPQPPDCVGLLDELIAFKKF